MALALSDFYQRLSALAPSPENRRFLLTISGGKDSVALAHLLRQLSLSVDWAHCNFHLRADDSNHDMQFVQELAEQWQVKLFVKEFDTYAEQARRGTSIEMTARDLRYAWFDELSASYDYIITAHHANDNAETLLLNLTRGTGLKGLTGIPLRNGKYIRPLLTYNSAEILHYIHANQLDFCVDKSNFSNDFSRNRIRNEVIPQLTLINANVIDNIVRNIAHLQQQYAFYEREVDRYRQAMVHKEGDRLFIRIERLLQHPDSALLLFELLKPFNFTAPVVAQVRQALCGECGRRFYSSTHTLLKDRNFLIVEAWCEASEPCRRLDHITQLESMGFSVEFYSDVSKICFTRDPQILYVDAKKLQSPIQLRHWQFGDFFYPWGMKGKKKLSDFFVDQKVDRQSKDRVLLLCAAQQIVWVVGYRSDRRFAIDQQTTEYYKITYYGNHTNE